MSDQRINSIKTPDYGITPKLNYYGTKTRVEFNRSCLKLDKITYTHGKVVNIYIVYELTGSNSDDNDHTLKKTLCLAQLLWLKMQILISKAILAMEFDLIEEEVFHFLALD